MVHAEGAEGGAEDAENVVLNLAVCSIGAMPLPD